MHDILLMIAAVFLVTYAEHEKPHLADYIFLLVFGTLVFIIIATLAHPTFDTPPIIRNTLAVAAVTSVLIRLEVI